MLIGDLALVSAALFTGAAFYVNFAEQPARLQLDDRSLLAQWKPAYKRGYVMQSTLAIAGFVLGAAAWWLSGILAVLLGAVLMLANWPWTLLGIMPTNRVLMATDLTSAGSASRALLVKWNGFMRYGPAWEPQRPYHSCWRLRRQTAPAYLPISEIPHTQKIQSETLPGLEVPGA
jgi:hypothetical protein